MNFQSKFDVQAFLLIYVGLMLASIYVLATQIPSPNPLIVGCGIAVLLLSIVKISIHRGNLRYLQSSHADEYRAERQELTNQLYPMSNMDLSLRGTGLDFSVRSSRFGVVLYTMTASDGDCVVQEYQFSRTSDSVPVISQKYVGSNRPYRRSRATAVCQGVLHFIRGLCFRRFASRDQLKWLHAGLSCATINSHPD